MALGPGLPGRLSLLPEVVEHHRVLVGVHAVPEALVAVRMQLAGGGELLEGISLQHAVLAQVVEEPGLEAEEASVDPVLGAGLLLEAADGAVAAVIAVAAEQSLEVDVGNPVGIGRAERALAELLGSQLDSPACRGVLARVQALDSHLGPPGLGGDEALDHLAQVSGAEDEALQSLRGVDLDHVPEDRSAADLHQRLRHRLGLLAQACSPAAAEDQDRGLAQPPATAGRMVTSSPSEIGVSRPS